MTTYSWPSEVVPRNAVIGYDANTITHRSWLSGFIQTQGFGAEVWRMTLYFRLPLAKRNELTGFIAQLNGPEHLVTLPVWKLAQRGAFGGTPVVNQANQSGTSLAVTGCSNNITNWIRRGDWFTVNNELKMCSADASSDGDGDITITFRPRLRVSPANGASLDVTTPTGVFRLATPSVEWSVESDHDAAETSLQFIENI